MPLTAGSSARQAQESEKTVDTPKHSTVKKLKLWRRLGAAVLVRSRRFWCRSIRGGKTNPTMPNIAVFIAIDRFRTFSIMYVSPSKSAKIKNSFRLS
jgi:hypothetical protein